MYSFPNLEPVVPCPLLSVASWPAYMFLRRQVRWSGIPILLRIFHVLCVCVCVWPTVKGFSIVNEAKVDVILDLSSFFYNPIDVGNLISGFSTFSKSSLSVHILLKPRLENFEHYFAIMWNECNCSVVGTFFGTAFGTGMKSDLFQSCSHCWVFQICWHIEFSTFTASSSRILNSSAGIP